MGVLIMVNIMLVNGVPVQNVQANRTLVQHVIWMELMVSWYVMLVHQDILVEGVNSVWMVTTGDHR
jgi:hypothetical protein